MAEPVPSDFVKEPPVTYPTRRQRRVLWNALTAVAALSLMVVAALFFYGFITFLSWSYPILLPIGLAVIIALLLDTPVALLQKLGLKRETATLSVCVLAVVGFLLFWAYLLPPLVSQTGDFFRSLPDMLSSGVSRLNESFGARAPAVPPVVLPTPVVPPASVALPTTNRLTLAVQAPTPPAVNDLLPPQANHYQEGRAEIQTWLKNNLPAIQETIQKNIANVIYSALGPVGQAFGFLLGFGFVPIYVYYFLADQERISKHWHEFVPDAPLAPCGMKSSPF